MAARLRLVKYEYDRGTNRTYARVQTPEFTETYDVSGQVPKRKVLAVIRPVVEARLAEFKDNPAEFDRCVERVKKSLHKYHRPGNPYAICTAAGVRRNLVLDPYTVTMLPGTLGYIEKQRERFARAARRNAAADIDSIRPGDRVTIRTPQGQERTGRAVMRSTFGGWVLDMGGRYGTPDIADSNNLTRVRRGRSSKHNKRRKTRSNARPAYYVVDEQYMMIVVHKGPYGSRARAAQVAKGSSHWSVMSYAELKRKEAKGYDVRGFSRSGHWSGWSNPAENKHARKNRGRRNPVDQSQDTYRALHGHDSQELVEITTPIHYHKHTAGLGELRKLIVEAVNGGKVTISNFGVNHQGKPCLLSTNEERTQLYIDGGDQAVNLGEFGVYEPYHDFETLGKVRNVHYFTRKDHLRPEDGGTAVYNHRFGGYREIVLPSGKKKRVRSPLPDLIYDVRSRLLAFSGGGYTVPDEGIDG